MQEAITLPTLSDTMETGRLIQWLKQPGDAVKKGDVLAEVETDKAVMDVEVFHDGYLSGPLAQTESDIPVGTVIGYLSDAQQRAQEDQNGATEKANVAPQEETGKKEFKERGVSPLVEQNMTEDKLDAPASIGQQCINASPYARGLARELGVDLSQVDAAADGVIHAPRCWQPSWLDRFPIWMPAQPTTINCSPLCTRQWQTT